MSEGQSNSPTSDPSLRAGSVDPQLRSGLATPNFEISAEKERTSLLLPLEGTDVVDPRILEELQAQGFTPKAEFHITALDIKDDSDRARVISDLNEASRTSMFEFIHGVTGGVQWEVTPRSELYVVEKLCEGEDIPRRSVIQMVDCPQLDAFYTGLNTFFPGDNGLEVPPAHITLATQGNPCGIGLSTISELHQFGRPLSLPE